MQEYLKMPFDETREQHRAAAYLPRPLYVLYMQSSAYKDACGTWSDSKQLFNDLYFALKYVIFVVLVSVHSTFSLTDKKLNVTIQGDADVAKAMEVSSADMGK